MIRVCFFCFTGNSITRKCAKPPITDCKVANNVTYCYCKNDACNNPGRKLDDPAPDQLLVSPYDQKIHKKKGNHPLTEKLTSIGTDFSDDEDIRIVNKNKRLVHHSGRPENDDEDEEGSGDEYYEELYYSESDESYPTDYSDVTERTDTDLIIEEIPVDNSKIDEIIFDDEETNVNSVGSKASAPKTSGADFFLSKSKTCLYISMLTLLLLSFH